MKEGAQNCTMREQLLIFVDFFHMMPTNFECLVIMDLTFYDPSDYFLEKTFSFTKTTSKSEHQRRSSPSKRGLFGKVHSDFYMTL